MTTPDAHRAYAVLVAPLCALCLVLTVAGDEVPIYSAQRTPQPPAIDGRLTDTCWSKAERSAPFVAIYGAAVEAETRGVLCWDEAYLYIGLICREPLLQKLREQLADGTTTGFEESIEVFLDGNRDRHSYVQVMVSARGDRYTAEGTQRRHALDAVWQAAVALGDGEWTVELRLPLDMLGVDHPSDRALCGLNLNRTRTLGGKTTYSCWSDTKGGFHTPARFGRLLFFEYRQWLAASLRHRLGAIERRARALAVDYPNATSEPASRIAELGTARAAALDALMAAPTMTARTFAPFFVRVEALVAEGHDLLADLRLAIIRSEFESGERPR